MSGAAPDDAEARARIRGLIHLLGGEFVPRDAPVLYARLPASRDSIGGIFSAEADERWIRAQPRFTDAVELMPAPPLADDGEYGNYPIVPDPVAPPEPLDTSPETPSEALDASLPDEVAP